MIAVNDVVLEDEDANNVLECLRSGWISSSGAFLQEFEEAWAAVCEVTHGVAVSNGTVALQIAMDALNLKPGDEVIMPTFTIISCAAAVIKAGGIPVLVDSDPKTWGMDVSQVRSVVSDRTRAIMPVHMYGHPVDMDPLMFLAADHGIKIVEDAAEVHGALYLSGRGTPTPKWRRCGGLGDLGTFSFYANKLITTGEGGMVVTNDGALAERLRSLRNLCFRKERRFLHTDLGYNFRLTNLQAAIGVAQIKRLDKIVARKRAIAQRYTERLKRLDWLQLPTEEPWARSVFWVYGLVVRDGVSIDAGRLAARLAGANIETRPFFLGMHEQPVFHRMGLFNNHSARFPVAERLARRGLYVPAGLGTTDEQIDAVCHELERISNEL